MGRPRDDFDWNLVDSLVLLHASERFIAERLLAGEAKPVNKASIIAKIKLIQRRIKERYGESFVQFRDNKGETTRIKLRQWQLKSAEAGNVTMQIWLGKNLLGQKDKSDEEIELMKNIYDQNNNVSQEDAITTARGKRE